MSSPSIEHAPPLSIARRRGVAGALTLLPAIVPLGLALGVTLGATASPAPIAWLSAPLLVAGASQLVLFAQLDAGAGFVAAGSAAVLLNSRFVVYGAALAQRLGAQPRWFRVVGAHYIVDQTYAMTLTGITDHDDDDAFRHFFATAGTVLWIAWTCSVGIGILAGPVLPPELPLEFVLSATFVALVVPGLSRRSEAAAAVGGAAVAVPGIGSTTTIVIAALVGGLVGASTSRHSTRHGSAGGGAT